MRRIWKDKTILMLCVTVFLSYLPEAGQYSCFFVYLRLVMDFSKVSEANINNLHVTIIHKLPKMVKFIFDQYFHQILGSRCHVHCCGRHSVRDSPNWLTNMFDEDIGVKTYNYGWPSFWNASVDVVRVWFSDLDDVGSGNPCSCIEVI